MIQNRGSNNQGEPYVAYNTVGRWRERGRRRVVGGGRKTRAATTLKTPDHTEGMGDGMTGVGGREGVNQVKAGTATVAAGRVTRAPQSEQTYSLPANLLNKRIRSGMQMGRCQYTIPFPGMADCRFKIHEAAMNSRPLFTGPGQGKHLKPAGTRFIKSSLGSAIMFPIYSAD